MSTALIFGASGQDGGYLAELLIQEGMKVVGTSLNGSFYEDDLSITAGDLEMMKVDITDADQVQKVIDEVQPNEIYNLAGQSSVAHSFEFPHETMQINVGGTLNILEAARKAESPKVFQASSCEIFGCSIGSLPLNEYAPPRPCSPYAISKNAAHDFVQTYREAYGMFAVSGILFNHESPRRPKQFVTRKITDYVGCYAIEGYSGPIAVGNMAAKRDWGYAKDYVRGMRLAMDHRFATDFIFGTGRANTVRDLITIAFQYIGVDVQWHNHGTPLEKGFNKKNGELLVVVDQELYRPIDVKCLIADSHKASTELGWEPVRSDLASLMRIMVDYDISQHQANKRQTIKATH